MLDKKNEYERAGGKEQGPFVFAIYRKISDARPEDLFSASVHLASEGNARCGKSRLGDRSSVQKLRSTKQTNKNEKRR